MKRFFKTLIVGMIVCLTSGTTLWGQVSHGGTPPSFKFEQIKNEAIQAEDIQINFNTEKIKAFDVSNEEDYGTPPCIAKAIPVDLTMENSGEWKTLPNGQKIWRLRIKAEGALAILLSYEHFYIPENASLFLYNVERTHVLGAFTAETNPTGGPFSTQMVAGDDIILEYVSSPDLSLTDAENKSKPNISISDVGYGYNYINVDYLVPGKGDELKYGESAACMININCSEGDDWQVEKKGVTQMMMYIGTGTTGAGWYVCSGTLVNNTSQDLTPYLLSANHCYNGASDEDLLKWQFTFHYESQGCEDAEPIAAKTTVGCVFRAATPTEEGSDGLLLELLEDIPEEWNVYYNGWDRRDELVEGGGVSIHHPAGDIKKISTFKDYETGTWPGEQIGAVNAHWLTIFIETENGLSVTEGGSSGSPMFNSSHLVIGTLTGGNSNCINTTGNNYYGKLWYHWDQYGNSPETQMKTWLDPLDLGVTTLEGVALNPLSPRITVDTQEISFTEAININIPTDADTIKVTGHNLNSDITAKTIAPFEVSFDGSEWDTIATSTANGGALLVRYTPPNVGSHSATITISNKDANSVNVNLYGSSCPIITFSTDSIFPNGNIGSDYEMNLSATGSTGPYSYEIIDGALPSGLSLGTDGKIFGIPSESGIFEFIVMTTDLYGCTGLQVFKLYVVCNVISSFPFSEDFESGQIPDCWSQEFVSDTVSWTCQTGGNNGDEVSESTYDDGFNTFFTSNDYNDDATKLITPQLDLKNVTNPVLRFWHTQEAWLNDQDELRIYSKSSAFGDWLLLKTYTDNIPKWTKEIISLPNPSSEYFVAFEATAKYGYGVAIDDISIVSSSISAAPSMLAFSEGEVGKITESLTINVIGTFLADSITAKTKAPFYVSFDGSEWKTSCVIAPAGGELKVRYAPTNVENITEILYLSSTGNEVGIELKGVAVTSGINKKLLNVNTIHAYPNPFTDILQISWENDVESLSIRNILGQEVYSTNNLKSINRLNVLTDTWSGGIYFIRLKSGNNQKIMKVIKD